MADEPEATASGTEAARPGLKAPRISSRMPPVIEGEAQDLAPPTPGTMSDIAQSLSGTEAVQPAAPAGPDMSVAPYAPSAHDAPDHIAIEPDGVTQPADAPFETPRRTRAPLWIGALVVLLAAGGLAALFATGDEGDLLSGLRRITGAPTPPSSTVAAPAPASIATKPPAAAPPAPAPSPAPPAPSAPPPRPTPIAAPVAVTPAPTAVPTPAQTPVAAPATPSADATRLATMETRLSELDAKLAALATAVAKPAADISAALDTQGKRLAALEAASDRLDKRLAALEAQFAAPKTAVRAPEAPDVPATRADEAAARTVVAQNLIAAVQSGEPYSAPLAAMRSLGAEDARLTQLSASAATGVPTLAALRSQFATLQPQLRSVAAPAPGASWRDALTARLASLVTIRPAGEAPGASAEAIASRIAAALARDDLPGALTLARSLSPADQHKASAWIEAASRRAGAQDEAQALLSDALGALAKPAPPKPKS